MKAQPVQTVLHRVAFLEVGTLKSRITRQKDEKTLLKVLLAASQKPGHRRISRTGCAPHSEPHQPHRACTKRPRMKPRNLTTMSTGLVEVSRKFHQLGSQNPVTTDHSFEPVKVRVANKLQYVTIHLQMKPAGKPPGP